MAFDISEGSTLTAGQQVGLIDTVQLQLKARQVGATREVFANQRPDIQAQIAVTKQQISKALVEQRRTQALLKEGAATSKQLDDAEKRRSRAAKAIAGANISATKQHA